ncbi:YD repeat-containing protein, partial [Streptacidiphilus jiangxiensis]
MSRSLSSQISTGLRRALQRASAPRASVGTPLGGKVRRPGRLATWTATVAVLVTLSTQPAEAFAAAHAGTAGSPVTPQQLSEALGNLKHQVSAADTSTGGAGTGKGHQPGKGELPGSPGLKGLGAPHLSGAGPAAQTGSHTQPPADLRDRQLTAAGKHPAVKAAPDATSATGIPGPAASGTEITSLRTATTSVFQNPDGTRTMRVYSRPVHFRKSDGTWGNIDTRLVQDSSGRWIAKSGDLGTSFAETATDPALVSWALDPSHQLSYSLQGAGAVTAQAKGNTITYPGALPSTDVVYDALATSIKETLVLHDANAPTSFTFPLNTTGLTAAMDQNGNVVFTDASGKADLVIPRGFMRDSTHHGDGQVSNGVTYQLTTLGGQQALKVSLDSVWLHDPSRVFPVKVDPTSTGDTKGQTTTSTFVESPYNTHYNTDPSLKVGTYDSGGHQATSYIEFPSIGTSSLQNQYIEKVTLYADAIDGSQCATPTEVDVRQIVGSWDPTQVTLASQVPLGSKIGNDTFAESNQNGCTSGTAWIPFDLGDNASADGTKMVENWVHGGSNYGVALTADLSDSNAWKIFDSASTSYPPYLSVTYSSYGADYSTPTSYTPPTATSTGSQSVTITNRGTSSWTSTNMKLKARFYDAKWNEISISAPMTAIPSTVAPNGSVTMTGTIPAMQPGTSYQMCWDLYINGTDSLYSNYGVPFQNCTWMAAANIPPQIDATEPLNNTTVTSLTPELFATGHDPDNYPGTGLTYDFQLRSFSGTELVDSNWQSGRNWVIPRGYLAWNGTYEWTVAVNDGKDQSAYSSPAAFTVQIQQPSMTSNLAQGSSDGRPFDPQVGNYTTFATDANVKVVGPALQVTRTYNSLDPRYSGMFGAGWSSLYDMRVNPDYSTAGDGGVVLTNAQGRQERFGRNTFALAGAASVGDVTGDGADDIVAVDDSTGDLYLYPGPDYSAATRIGIAHNWTSGGELNPKLPSGNWSTLTNLTGGQVDGNGHGDLIGVDPSDGSLWEFTGKATGVSQQPCSGAVCAHIIMPWQSNGPFSSYAPAEIGTGGWNGMTDLTVTPPLSGDGKKDLLAVEKSTGILWAYPFNSDGTIGSRVEVGTGGWNGMRELTGGTFNGAPGLMTIDPNNNLKLYPAKGTGTLGTGVWNTTSIEGPGWATYQGLAAVNGISGDTNTDFVATDMSAGVQYLYHSTGGYAGGGKTTTGMDLYTSPQGEAQDLYPQTDGSWVLRDSTGTTYTFVQGAPIRHTWGPIQQNQEWLLSSIKDKNGNTQNLTWTNNSLATVTDTASGRALHFTWDSTGSHVTQIATDATDSGQPALTWTYTYGNSANPNELTQVCAPPTGTNTSPSCTNYTYTDSTTGGTPGNHYRTAVMDAGPKSYWRLGDKLQSTSVADEVLANEGADNGTPTGVDLGESPGTPALLTGAPTTVAGFNGTSSQISLPDDTVKTSYLSVGMWFKTTTKGGVLFSYQADSLAKATTSNAYTPALYIGASGKLYGQFFGTGASIAPMSTSASVADGNWHFVVLAAAGNQQQLWLDGSQAASLTAQVQPIVESKTYVGAGFLGGLWPDQPHTTGNTGYATYFNGQIGEVATYEHALGATAIVSQYESAAHPASELTGIQLPSGKSKLAVTYDAVNDRASKITDSNGGNWTLHVPTASGSVQAYRTAVKGSTPSGYWTLSDWNGTQAANQQYSARPTPNNGTYSNVTLGATGALAGETSATFDGTDSWAELPATNVPQVGPDTISLYFDTSQPGVLFSYQSFPIGAAHASGGTDQWNPALYVGTDGKLHAELWNGKVDPLATTGTVTDAKWHSVVLTATSTNSQTLYLDGTSVGTLSGTISANGTGHVFVGAGASDGWPSATNDPDGHFNGQISNVAVYPFGLNSTQVSNLATAAASVTGLITCHATIGCSSNPHTMYDSAVLGLHPTGYWPFDDDSGNIATELVSAAAAEQNRGTYSGTTRGTSTGLWASGSTQTTTFDGTSSYVQLPRTIAPKWSPASVEVWFNTNSPGVIYSYQVPQIGTSGGAYNPALYVGTDDKLHGEFWNGSSTGAMSSTQTVTGNGWHLAALVANGNTQQLYLDGQPTGAPLTGTVQYNGNSYAYLGAGHDSGWPSAPTDADGHFNGSLADFSTYNYGLSATTILGDYQAATTADNGTGATADEAYRTRIVADGAADYWRLDDPASSPYAQDELGTSLPDPYSGTYTSTTLGSPGPSGTPDASAAGFDGSTSSLQLPDTAAPITGPASIELWFKTSTSGVLYSYQTNPLGTATTSSDDWNPALYIGSDGKLRGQFWTGATANTATSTSTVTDNNWHQAVLTATGSTQHLYLDGVSQATINAGPVQFNGDAGVYIGAGTVTGWPGAPTTDSTGTNHFHGTIAEVSYYPAALDATTVTSHYQAMGNAASPSAVITATVTDPGSNTLTYKYDATGEEIAKSDAYGNTTSYTYDTAGNLHTVTDPDGHATTYGHDARGNTVSTTTCRTAGNCQTSYATYYLDTTNALDPANDQQLIYADARSSSSTDTTYQTDYGYDSAGNLTSIRRPDLFSSNNTYTAGTEAAVGGGTEPPGLIKTSSTFDANTTTSYAYNSKGDLISITNPAGLVTSYSYDDLGRIKTKTVSCTDCSTGAQATTTTFTWDGEGNPLTQTDPAISDPVNGTITHQRVTTDAYDPDGDRTSETVSDVAGNDKARTTTWAYTNSTNDLVTSTTDPAGSTTKYGYDAYGNRTSSTDPSGTSYSYSYSPMGQLQQTAITNFTGNPNSPVSAHLQIVDSRAYDPAGRLATDTDGMGRTTHTYYYDDNLVSEVDLDSFHDFNPQTKALTGTTRNIVEQTNTYDAAGNLTQSTTGGGKTTVTNTYDTDGRVTSGTLDPAGLNRTTSYTYDNDNHLLSTVITGGGQTRETDNTYDSLGD